MSGNNPVIEFDEKGWTWYPSRAMKGLRVSITNERGEVLDDVTRIKYKVDEIIGINDKTGDEIVVKLPLSD